ncbi:membrane fusion protein (multidrug efflux system) [Chitinophaga skermanii]|uniref:Membrane fusion protein (Multidrug efflux system) n=1 Tax=Chitinophaga skermanii TaxID=331697 RepID=A0A327QYS7_9BACT|nr:efflux RND transporter periplasmic adaptor subunit [Chitinophaga skermanii]RAJ08864.1 membrane fusion protein (multidrug efflux system) [Chitinophaga skermanii]
MATRFFELGKVSNVALILSIALLISSCGGNHQEQQQWGAPVDVDFLEIQPTTAQIEKKYPGAIEGTVNVDIKAQVTGYLEEIFIKEGDYVQKGQNLFKIKGDVFNEQVNNSQAALKAAMAAEETSRIELEKIKPLVAGKVVSEMQLQTAEANYASAKAAVAQAKAALGSSQINAAFSLIKAPVNGYIGRIPNRIGNLVTPADATPLTTLSEINNVFVYFSLSEADYIAFMKDRATDTAMSTVEMIMADGTVYDQKGTLEMASGNINATTGSIPLKAVFPNPNKLLRAGGSAKIILRKTMPGSLTVPMTSVKDIQDKYFVFALGDSNKVKMKPIEIAGKSGDLYILKSGLQAKEKIALNRIDVLNEGSPVVPSAPNAAPAQASATK